MNYIPDEHLNQIERNNQAIIERQFTAWCLNKNLLPGDPAEMLNNERLSAQERGYIESIMYLMGR